MSVILAEPWVGEFGWELFCWQAYLRRLKNQGNEVIVSSRKCMEYLYKDFCCEFIPFEPDNNNASAYHCKTEKILDISNIKFDKKINPTDGIVFYARDKKLWKLFSDQDFIKYGRKSIGYDIVIHARSTNKCNTGYRNWSMDKWVELLGKFKGKSIACIGLESGSMHIPNTANKIGLPLEGLSNLLFSSKIIVGPSSGPMHYASLCGTDQIVWGEKKNDKKYAKHWNPFDAEVLFHNNCYPSVDKVEKMIKKYFGRF